MANNGPFYEIGNYVGEVIQQGLTQAKTGTAQFLLRVKILGTPTDDGAYEPCTSFERSIYMALTPNTMQYVTPNLKQLGFTGTSLAQLDSGAGEKFQSFIGHQVDLWCSHEDDNSGNKREKWMISSPRQPIELVPVDAKKLRQLDALFGKALKDAPEKVSRKPEDENQDRAHYNNPEITDDDLPASLRDEDERGIEDFI